MYRVNLNENVYLMGEKAKFNIRIAVDEKSIYESENPKSLGREIYENVTVPAIRNKQDDKPLVWRVTEGGEFVGTISWNGGFWDKNSRNGANYWEMSDNDIKVNVAN
jgi:hypothetical protein